MIREKLQLFSSCTQSFEGEARGWNTLLVFALSACYLNIKVNRSANEMLFCLAFREVFFFQNFLFLRFWIQISNWTTMRFEGASRFDFFFFLRRGLLKNFPFFRFFCNCRKNNEWIEKKTSLENFLVLWILNWQFNRNCIGLRFLN